MRGLIGGRQSFCELSADDEEGGFMGTVNAGIILAAATIAAVTTPTNARTLMGVMMVEGSCGRLVALDTDVTQYCQGKITSNSFDDGRSSFTFIANAPDKSPLLLTFSGQGKSQVKQSEDIAVQPVDVLFTNLDGKTLTDKAVGYCRFGNPYKVGAIVNCVAETADGSYVASFRTSGKEPSRLDPNKRR